MSSKIWPSHLFHLNLPVNEVQGDINCAPKKIPIFFGVSLIQISYFVTKKSFMKEAEINPHIMHDIFRSWLEVVRRGTIQWPWHRSGSQFLWSCQYFERLGTGRERERGGKGKSTQGSCSQARVTLASAQAAAFTYFPTLRLNLAQAFHSVS